MVSGGNLVSWLTSRAARIALLACATLLLFSFLVPPIDRLPSLTSTRPEGARPDAATSDGESKTSLSTSDLASIRDTASYFIDFPLEPPYKDVFGELGRRSQVVRDWLTLAANPSVRADTRTYDQLTQAIEDAVMALYPFLQRPQEPKSRTPLADLRSRFDIGSVGIVISAGDANVRYAATLIANVRAVLGSTLPIEIAYLGDKDLSADGRLKLEDAVNNILAGNSKGAALEYLDLTTLFDNGAMRFGEENSGWATKSFAALGSRFEKVILIDADAVFLQPPEVLTELVRDTGAFLFHDRLLWQHGFRERHDWWKDQIRHPSATLNKSLVWTEDYAEEGDSGVVVLDKSRDDVIMGLLHICWQNTYEVRKEVTYKITYGDKESWWLGFELAGTSYEMERHYGGIIGWKSPSDDRSSFREGICSFVIAHVDSHDKLLWYNGGLLKNKLQSDTEYAVPEGWVLDGTWEKGATKADMSCMYGTVRDLSAFETDILSASVDMAERLDPIFQHAP